MCIRDRHDTIPDPPANDECAAAETLTPSSTQSCVNSISGNLLGATASDVPDCAGSGGFDDDVWYQFVAGAVSHVITLANIAGSTQDLDIQVLTGSDCGSLSEIACHQTTASSTASFEVNGLNDNGSTTYYIRVATVPTGMQTTTFDICVSTPSSGCDLLVTSTAASGPGSLREMVGCSSSGDTIRIDASLAGDTIQLSQPPITIAHSLVWAADMAHAITLGNAVQSNTEVLIDIQADLELVGLILDGLTAESLILSLGGSGGLELTDAAIIKATIDRQ